MFVEETEVPEVNTKAGTWKPAKWYNHELFPLIPVFKTRPANEYNTFSWSFCWLVFKIWSLDSFQFELAAVIDDHWGIGFTCMVPYTRIIIAVPCPPKLSTWVMHNLWRQPKKNHY